MNKVKGKIATGKIFTTNDGWYIIVVLYVLLMIKPVLQKKVGIRLYRGISQVEKCKRVEAS